ncbi:hypothetical protein FRUB_03679 [Fimbriiglobus ruber]|uniref:Uncharacterized protein n=1 Tax=Fimbriiglobus ruber TaxID=1908690 RepID=A0A225DJG5_9BACT|nr:hypothetical protein FRUB_03679 [Fimbriiglobus ruber]
MRATLPLFKSSSFQRKSGFGTDEIEQTADATITVQFVLFGGGNIALLIFHGQIVHPLPVGVVKPSFRRALAAARDKSPAPG